jgi:hypothetical protein
MKYRILTFDKLAGKREVFILNAETEQDAREKVASATVQVMGVVSLSILDRLAKSEAEAAQVKWTPTAVLERRAERLKARSAHVTQ